MTVYLVARLRIHDRTQYAEYEAGFAEVFHEFGGTILAVDDDSVVLEGDDRTDRSVILSFPTEAQALAWYRSDRYQTLAKHRHAASDAEVTLVRGGLNVEPRTP